jgi:hypothetical protein
MSDLAPIGYLDFFAGNRFRKLRGSLAEFLCQRHRNIANELQIAHILSFLSRLSCKIKTHSTDGIVENEQINFAPNLPIDLFRTRKVDRLLDVMGISRFR